MLTFGLSRVSSGVTCCVTSQLLKQVDQFARHSMTKQNHDELTTDDLLKLQEGPPSKRIRFSSPLSLDPRPSVGINDESSSASSGPEDDPTDQEDSQDETDSFPGKVDDEQIDSNRLQSKTAIENSGRLKLYRTSPISAHTPRLAQAPKHSITFGDMGISSVLEAALRRMSIHKPTEIQAACIPPILAGAVWWSADSVPDFPLTSAS